MKRKQTKLINLSGIVIFCLCFLALVSAGQTVPPPASWQTKDLHWQEKKISLLQAMKKFSGQTGCNFFIDGEPLQKEADFDLDLAAKDVLEKIADAFDYTWTLSKRGVILLNKRFKNPDELPQTHLREMRRMAKDLLSLWPAASSEARSSYYPFGHLFIYAGNGLYRTFTADQLALLQSGQKLTYSQLTPEQQRIVNLGINNEFAGTWHDDLEMLDACLGNLPHSTLQFRLWHNISDSPEANGLNTDKGSLDCIWDEKSQVLGYFRVALHPSEEETNARNQREANKIYQQQLDKHEKEKASNGEKK